MLSQFGIDGLMNSLYMKITSWTALGLMLASVSHDPAPYKQWEAEWLKDRAAVDFCIQRGPHRLSTLVSSSVSISRTQVGRGNSTMVRVPLDGRKISVQY